MNLEDQQHGLFRLRNVSRDLALAPEPDVEVPAAEPFTPRKLIRIQVPEPVSPPPPVEVNPAEKQALERAHWMTGTLLKLALFVSILAVMAGGYLDLQTRVASSADELLALEQKHATLLQRHRKVAPMKAEAESLLDQRRLLDLDRQAPRWTRSLQKIALKAGPDVELLEILARSQADETGLASLHLDVRTISGTPRATAENFRRMLEADLKPDFLPGGVKAVFVPLDGNTDSPSDSSISRTEIFKLNARAVASRRTAWKGGTP